MRVLNALLRDGRRSREAVVAFQQSRLRRLIAHACQKVPYYRALFERHELGPGDVRTLEELPRIPITDRQTLQSLEPREIVTEGVDPERLILRRTSGSSGRPIDIRRTWPEERILGAFRWRASFAQGVRPTDRRAAILHSRAKHPRDHQIHLRVAQALGCLRSREIDCFLTDEEMVAQLLDYRPQVIAGFAASIWRLATHVEGLSGSRPRPRLVQVAGEVTTPAMRRTVSKAFGAPVRDLYASHEVNLIAWECAEGGRLHTCDDSVIVEVLRDGRPARPGERGEVVITGLHSFAMPFIRFRLGDLVTQGAPTCDCGSSFGTIHSVQGRMNDFLRLPDGRSMHAYDVIDALVLEGVRLRQYQVTQERPDQVVIRLVPENPRFDDEERPGVLEALRLRLPEPIEIDLRVVDRLEPETSGKFRVLRSRVASAYDEIDWDRLSPGPGTESPPRASQ